MIHKKYILLILCLFCTEKLNSRDFFGQADISIGKAVIILPICFIAQQILSHIVLPSILLSLKNRLVIDYTVWILAKTRLISQLFINEERLYFDAINIDGHTKENIELALAITYHYNKIIGNRAMPSDFCPNPDLIDSLVLATAHDREKTVERLIPQLSPNDKNRVLYHCLKMATFRKAGNTCQLLCDSIENFNCAYRSQNTRGKLLLFEVAANAQNIPAFTMFLNRSNQKDFETIQFDQNSRYCISVLLNQDQPLCHSFVKKLSIEQRSKFHQTVMKIDAKKQRQTKKTIPDVSIVKAELESLQRQQLSATQITC